MASADDTPNFTVTSLSAYYGELRAIYDISLELNRGDVLAIIGANGAGKSTLLKSITGLMNHGARSHIRGSIQFEGQRLDKLMPDAIVNAGIALVPEGRRLFERLSVEDNLLAGAYLPRCRAGIKQRLDEVFTLFPKLRERRAQVVSQMSGGEQQMVAIGRALMSGPKLLALDEPSLGLAPLVVAEIFNSIRQLRDKSGLTILLVEQNASRALAICDYAYIMENGRVVLDGTGEQLRRNADVREFYLGLSSKQGRTHMKDVKHYKRRKRWLS
ncbi:MAG: ABC transporter ATP-binding protein [Rubrivivax sp.]